MFVWRERLEASGAEYGVEWMFTDRRGGSSLAPFGALNLALHVGDEEGAVVANRRRLAHELGLEISDLRFMDQQHGRDVAMTRRTGSDGFNATLPAVDGIITDRADEALVVLVADCTPVLLVDRVEGLAAAVHAGRPGMMKGIVRATVSRLRELGAGDLDAVVGPSVCPRCYEVPAVMRDDAAAVEPASAGVTWTGTPAIDVASGVVAQLAREDVAIRWLPGCTRERDDLFSYRRDGTTGRFAGVVRLLPPERAA